MSTMILVAALLIQAERPTSNFEYFPGTWRCEGHFEPSKRPISSTMVFTLDAATGALEKKHTDLPPGRYRAVEQWVFSPRSGSYRDVVNVVGGRSRTYVSRGWEGPQWAWSRTNSAGEPEDRFVYRRLDEGVMAVDWFIDRGNGLVLGDTLTCSRS